MALFGLPLQRLINGHRLIQYIYHYLQILFVSCFNMRKKGLSISWGWNLLCISSRTYVAMETNLSFRSQLISFQPVIYQTQQYFIVNQERMQHYMNVLTKIQQNIMGRLQSWVLQVDNYSAFLSFSRIIQAGEVYWWRQIRIISKSQLKTVLTLYSITQLYVDKHILNSQDLRQSEVLKSICQRGIQMVGSQTILRKSLLIVPGYIVFCEI